MWIRQVAYEAAASVYFVDAVAVALHRHWVWRSRTAQAAVPQRFEMVQTDKPIEFALLRPTMLCVSCRLG